jgi:predicted nucleic acid-binding protein
MFYAAADRGDRSNVRAKEVLATGERLLTSDHVLVETWLLMAHRLGRDSAQTFWERIQSGGAAVEPATQGDLQVALDIAHTFSDQDFSIVDCTSFALMQRLGVHRAASLDDHYAVFRFGKSRNRAFEIVR